jgi:cyclophilin family peptidyl-prolyl cis-trans isomerase
MSFPVRFLSRLLTLCCLLLLSPLASATIVRLQTSLGAIDLTLYDTAAPRTVANFLAYVNSGRYVNSFIHRSVPGFVIQGGGYIWDDSQAIVLNVTANAAVVNEFSTTRSNKRGTIAMAKAGGDPNSATSQWFINLADNGPLPVGLDSQNGGFTVFGEVSAGSMAVVDAIARLPLVNEGSPFDSLPLATPFNTAYKKANFVIINAAIAVANSYQGLWWNASEDGWGMSLTQHGNLLFAAIYTYDDNKNPVWYVIPNCPLAVSSCAGDAYKVTGATPPTLPWNGNSKLVEKVGSGSLSFTSTTAGTFSFTLNGVSSSKAITLQPLATGTTPPAIDYTDLWWNVNESGWGLSISQQFNIIFAAWYTYDAAGKPVWYVAPNCPVTGASCSSTLYRVTGATSITTAWNASGKVVEAVGSIGLFFTDAANGTMGYNIGGNNYSRVITRQVY